MQSLEVFGQDLRPVGGALQQIVDPGPGLLVVSPLHLAHIFDLFQPPQIGPPAILDRNGQILGVIAIEPHWLLGGDFKVLRQSFVEPERNRLQ